jgi:transcriptional regulator with XRE-family HTH domain
MRVGEKLRYLRTIEGTLRGLEREMTQQSVSAAIQAELGVSISQSYLSQIERGLRPHLTNTTRMALASFFNVHPGYLVDDPEGFHTELTSDVRTLETNLDQWLLGGAERFSHDPLVHDALVKIAEDDDSRHVLGLISAILDAPGLAGRLLQVLRPELANDTLVPRSPAEVQRTRDGQPVDTPSARGSRDRENS